MSLCQIEDFPISKVFVFQDIRFQAESEQVQNGQRPNGLDLPLCPAGQGDAIHTLVLASDGSLSPQRNQSFIAAVIGAIRQATTHSGKRLSLRQGASKRSGGGSAQTTGTATGAQEAHGNGGTITWRLLVLIYFKLFS